MNFPLLMPTAEPFFHRGGKIGCLLIHGFTGTPKEMTWLGEDLARRGHTVLGIRLFAHAVQMKDMQRARWHDWMASIEDGLNILRDCTQVQFVMGLSLGAILTLVTAAYYPIAGAVAISTPYPLSNDPRLKLVRLLFPFIHYVGKGRSDFRNKAAEKIHTEYPRYPTRSVLEVQKISGLMYASLPLIKVPVLLVQSHGDLSIPADSMQKIHRRIGSRKKEMMWVENSGHVVIREPDRQLAFDRIGEFIKRNSRLK
jgi:carboxylesterase